MLGNGCTDGSEFSPHAQSLENNFRHFLHVLPNVKKLNKFMHYVPVVTLDKLIL